MSTASLTATRAKAIHRPLRNTAMLLGRAFGTTSWPWHAPALLTLLVDAGAPSGV